MPGSAVMAVVWRCPLTGHPVPSAGAEEHALDHDCELDDPVYPGADELEKTAKELGAVLYADRGHELMVGFYYPVAERTDAHHWLNLWWSGIGSWRY